MAKHAGAQQGYVLWSLLVMLGVMTELAITSLKVAAHEGIGVRLTEQRFQQSQWLALMAHQLERLPVPSRTDADKQQIWHPLRASPSQGCGRMERALLTQERQNCTAIHQPLLSAVHEPATWQWRLSVQLNHEAELQEGTDLAAFPMLKAQAWQLELISGNRSGTSPQGLWLRYEQVSP